MSSTSAMSYIGDRCCIRHLDIDNRVRQQASAKLQEDMERDTKAMRNAFFKSKEGVMKLAKAFEDFIPLSLIHI